MSGLDNQTHVGCFVSTSVLGKSGKQYQREIERLLANNGPEWVSTRLKAIWVASNHLRNGDVEAAIAIYRENSISYHSDGTPKGPIRPAVVGYSHVQKPSKIRAFAAVLRYYCSIKLDDLTPKQRDKAESAITSDPGSTDHMIDFLSREAMEASPDTLFKVFDDHDFGNKVEPLWEPPLDQRYANSMRSMSYYYSRNKLPGSMKVRNNPYSSMVMSMLTEPYVPSLLDYRTPCFEMRELIRSRGFGENQSYVGRITALQEQGAKARVVAMPSAWVQLSFLPLHKRLKAIIQGSFPTESCIDSQRKAMVVALKHLNSGRETYSVDLSSATDRFPRRFSTQILRGLGLADYADALEELSSSTWSSPWGPCSYRTGQPMGLYGSFPLFHLSNSLCANLAVERCMNRAVLENSSISQESWILDNSFIDGPAFFVLGDDVIFGSKLISDEYRNIMSDLGVDISQSKSFSGKVAEFAGFMAVPSTNGFVGFRPYKTPVGSIVTNPINLLDSVGPYIAKSSSRWRKLFKDYQDTAVERSLDLSPLFPEDVTLQDNPFRGDTSTVMNLSNVLARLMPEGSLPDLGRNSKINRIPLFHERRVGELYGYSPEMLVIRDKERDVPGYQIPTSRAYRDPLMRRARSNRIRRTKSTIGKDVDEPDGFNLSRSLL